MSKNIHKQIQNTIVDTLNELIQDNDGEFPNEISISELTKQKQGTDCSIFYALNLLSSLGLIDINNEKVIVKSKYSNIALCAIRARMELGIPLFQHLREENVRQYYTTFTKNLEVIRKEYHGDAEPIHHRKILNIIIKGKQIRNFKFHDVFLHVFHSSWNQYHLLGLGYRGEESQDQLIDKAMYIKLRLDKSKYEVDQSLFPPTVVFESISEAHGALTRYEIETRVIKLIKLDLNKHIESLIESNDEFSPSYFKWVTLEEVKQKTNEHFEIMESSLQVLENFGIAQQSPVVVKKAKYYDNRKLLSFEFKSDIGNRFSLMQILIILIIFVLLIIIVPILGQYSGENFFLNILHRIIELIIPIIKIFGEIV